MLKSLVKVGLVSLLVVGNLSGDTNFKTDKLKVNLEGSDIIDDLENSMSTLPIYLKSSIEKIKMNREFSIEMATTEKDLQKSKKKHNKYIENVKLKLAEIYKSLTLIK